MAWLVLILSGLLEAAWASVLPATNGFRRLLPTAAFLGLLGASMYGLAYAARSIPIGTAYAVWVGIGAVGTIVIGIVVHGDDTSPGQLLALGALVGSIVAVNLTSPH